MTVRCSSNFIYDLFNKHCKCVRCGAVGKGVNRMYRGFARVPGRGTIFSWEFRNLWCIRILLSLYLTDCYLFIYLFSFYLAEIYLFRHINLILSIINSNNCDLYYTTID